MFSGAYGWYGGSGVSVSWTRSTWSTSSLEQRIWIKRSFRIFFVTIIFFRKAPMMMALLSFPLEWSTRTFVGRNFCVPWIVVVGGWVRKKEEKEKRKKKIFFCEVRSMKWKFSELLLSTLFYFVAKFTWSSAK